MSPHYVDLVYDACLKSFWRKKALANFLRQCKVSESFISTWTPGETKRDFLDRLFAKLVGSDQGRLAILHMSQHLREQKSFPDLQNWEDSEQKLRSAHTAVGRLRNYHDKQQQEIVREEEKQESRARFRQSQQEYARSQTSLKELNDRLNELSVSVGTQRAGYEFQDWFFDLLDYSEIINRKPYVINGRQIDGSLTISETTYLIELKFTSAQASATDIDSFYRKVVTKADNTMGIFVSIAGFSSVAIDEASGERTPLLLMDHGHLYLMLTGAMSIADIIHRVRRHASQTGEAYLPASDFTI